MLDTLTLPRFESSLEGREHTRPPDSPQAGNIVRLIVFISTDGHGHTVRHLAEGMPGVATPVVRRVTYDALLKADSVPAATYIFTDLERLYPWERVLASHLFRVLEREGNRCLNDPTRVLGRYELLKALHGAGYNPFRGYRADDDPRPSRFPVFVRVETDHGEPISDLIENQAALERELEQLAGGGIPRAGLLVIEYCAQPIAPERWRKWGTFRIGERMHTDHCVVEDTWLVKYGKPLASDEMFEEESRAVNENRFGAAIEPAFRLAGVDYGRADHAEVDGRQVVYEINTNPDIKPVTPHPRSEVRTNAMVAARRRLIECLAAIDTDRQDMCRIEPTGLMKHYARQNRDRRPVIRP
jgi:hypothetical protein